VSQLDELHCWITWNFSAFQGTGAWIHHRGHCKQVSGSPSSIASLPGCSLGLYKVSGLWLDPPSSIKPCLLQTYRRILWWPLSCHWSLLLGFHGQPPAHKVVERVSDCMIQTEREKGSIQTWKKPNSLPALRIWFETSSWSFPVRWIIGTCSQVFTWIPGLLLGGKM